MVNIYDKEDMENMPIEKISRKQLNDLEHHTRELLAIMRKAKLMDEPLAEMLKLLEQRLGEVRREQFDANNPEYKGF